MEGILVRIARDGRMLFRLRWEISIGKERKRRKRMRNKMKRSQEKRRKMIKENYQLMIWIQKVQKLRLP